jgi:hypothetical protein
MPDELGVRPSRFAKWLRIRTYHDAPVGPELAMPYNAVTRFADAIEHEPIYVGP